MRILLLTSRYLPHRGGLETVVHELTAQMKLAGHVVIIVTNRYPASLPKQEQIDNISVTRLFFIYPEWRALRAGRPVLWLAGFVLLPLTLLRLYLILRRFRPDVVNFHYVGAPALFVWLLHRLYGFRLVVSLHGGDVDAEPYKSRFKRWLFRAVLNRATSVTACSKELLNQALTLAPEAQPKAQVIHNGVNVDLFMNALPYEHPRAYLLAVGQLGRHKGFDVLIDAFAQVVGELPGTDLLIAGEGPEHAALRAQIEAAGLGERVLLLGPMNTEQVARLMRGCRAMVIPSRREPFGIVGLEAEAAGCPIIARRVGGLVEALEGAEVTWVMDDSPASLADAFRKVLMSNAPQGLFSAANQLVASKHSWAIVALQYLAALAMCLD